jgi:hypothetical protein
MDFHFVKPEGVAPKGKSDLSKSFKIVSRFLPLFLLAAILPFMIALVAAPPDIDFLTRADSEQELRVWIEPANVVMSEGGSTTLTVMVQYDGETSLIPEISLDTASSEMVSISSESRLTYSTPFSGKVELGKIIITADGKGSGNVSVLKDSIVITAFDAPLEISTADANVVVR